MATITITGEDLDKVEEFLDFEVLSETLQVQKNEHSFSFLQEFTINNDSSWTIIVAKNEATTKHILTEKHIPLPLFDKMKVLFNKLTYALVCFFPKTNTRFISIKRVKEKDWRLKFDMWYKGCVLHGSYLEIPICDEPNSVSTMIDKYKVKSWSDTSSLNSDEYSEQQKALYELTPEEYNERAHNFNNGSMFSALFHRTNDSVLLLSALIEKNYLLLSQPTPNQIAQASLFDDELF